MLCLPALDSLQLLRQLATQLIRCPLVLGHPFLVWFDQLVEDYLVHGSAGARLLALLDQLILLNRCDPVDPVEPYGSWNPIE